MISDTAQTRYSSLESLFASIMDASDQERDRVLAALERSDASLARDARELIRIHEQPIPLLDDSPLPRIEPKDGFSMIDASIGGWRITRHIGRGGWADVYEARQDVPDRVVALKVLRWPWLCTPRTLRRFRDEAELLARVEHPAVARVYGAGVASVAGVEVPYLALELVPEATPITTYARDHNLSLRRRLRLLIEVCDAVNAAHRRGVLHRDLKPSNVLVGSDDRPRVIDFGVAYAMDHAGATMTCTGELVGTVGYMSPERLAAGEGGRAINGAGSPQGEPPDARWDTYSLGMILYELVVGASPYALPTNVASAVAMVLQVAPARPRSVARSLPQDLCTIIETAIEREPTRRYQSVADLGADLERFLSSRPITARPTPVHRRLRLAARRHPALAAAMLCSALGAAAVIATGIRGWSATRQELRATELSLNVLDDAMAVARSRRNGDAVRISDLLERLERPLKDGAPLSPRVAARLHDMIGRTYEDLADYRAALDHYAAGLVAARSVWNDDEPLVVRLKVELAGSLYDRGEPAAAARMLEDLLASSGRLEPSVLAKVKNDLAVAHMKAENWPEAERVGLQAYALRVELLGEGDPASVQTLINLGANAMRLGEHHAARQRLTRAVELARALGPEGIRPGIHALSYLGLTLALLGDAPGSAEACEQAARQAPQLYDRSHPVYLKLSLVWAQAALQRAEWDRATELAQDVAARAVATLGPENPDTTALAKRAESITAQAQSRQRTDPP